MKVLHLATSLTGGAGIAARRINDALNKNGFNSHIVSLQQNELDIKLTETVLHRNYRDQFLSRANTLVQRSLIQTDERLITTISHGVLKYEQINGFKPEILNIHATYNFISDTVIKKLIKDFPITAVTLHDQRMFTGGCHYSGNCENFKNICEKCPQVRSGFRWLVVRDQIQKTKMYSKFGRIVTMSPSSWLAKLAQESTALKNTAIEVIQNPIPEEFIRHLKLEKKSSYVVGFVSANLDNPYKGVDVLVKAMNLLSSKKSIPPFRLVAIGKGSLKGLSNNVVVEYFQAKNNFEMIPLLDGIDLLVVPSNQDNSPSVIGEALLHGIPVLGSDVGGIPELLGRFNCQTFKSGSHVDLANEIEKHFDGEVKQLPSQAIIEFFSERTYAKRFKEIIDLHSQ